MKTDYITRAKKFYEKVYPDIYNFERPQQFISYFKDFNIKYHRNVQVCYGATRVVIIASDYAIKIDYYDSDFGNCSNEEDMYDYACKVNMQDLFCPITKIAPDAWVMPRTSTRENRNINENLFWNSLDYEEKIFVNEHIQDIHDGNIGFYKGHYVLIDYACHD